MKSYSNDDTFSYILGISLIIEALNEVPKQVTNVVLSSKANKNSELDKLLDLCNIHNIPYSYDDNLINKISLKENCYGIAYFNKYKHSLQTKRHIVLFGFHDEGELGTILRSAVSFNFKDVVLINSDIDIFNPKVIRASMGSFFHLNIVEFDSFDEYISTYNYNIYCCVSKANKELKDIVINEPFSIIIPKNLNNIASVTNNEFYLNHHDYKNIPITSLCSIVFNYVYHQIASDNYNVYRAH